MCEKTWGYQRASVDAKDSKLWMHIALFFAHGMRMSYLKYSLALVPFKSFEEKQMKKIVDETVKFCASWRTCERFEK